MQTNTIMLPRILPVRELKGNMRSAREEGLLVVHHQDPAYQRLEKKPRICLLPGINHTAAHFEFLSNQLVGRGFEVTAIELPRQGEDLGKRTSVEYRDAVIDFLFAQEEPVFLLGHSFGGMLAQMVVAKMGREKIKGLVLLASGATSETRMGIGLAVFVQTIKNIFNILLSRPARFKDKDTRKVFFNGELADSLFKSFTRHYVPESGTVFREIARTTLPAWMPYSYRLKGDLGHFSGLPVLQLNAAFDRVITAGTSGRLSKHLESLGADLESYLIPGPHNLHWNNVGAVADKINRWQETRAL